MALQGPIPVEFAHVFPRGAFAAGAFEPVRDFEASKGGRFVQSKDKQSGLPLWLVDVIDADPAARDKTARVKIAAADQPVLPAAPAGLPFVPVEFTGLTVTPYVNQGGRLAYSLRPPSPRIRGVRAAGERGMSGATPRDDQHASRRAEQLGCRSTSTRAWIGPAASRRRADVSLGECRSHLSAPGRTAEDARSRDLAEGGSTPRLSSSSPQETAPERCG